MWANIFNALVLDVGAKPIIRLPTELRCDPSQFSAVDITYGCCLSCMYFFIETGVIP